MRRWLSQGLLIVRDLTTLLCLRVITSSKTTTKSGFVTGKRNRVAGASFRRFPGYRAFPDIPATAPFERPALRRVHSFVAPPEVTHRSDVRTSLRPVPRAPVPCPRPTRGGCAPRPPHRWLPALAPPRPILRPTPRPSPAAPACDACVAAARAHLNPYCTSTVSAPPASP